MLNKFLTYLDKKLIKGDISQKVGQTLNLKYSGKHIQCFGTETFPLEVRGRGFDFKWNLRN
ncbi:hypothetical protein BPO_0312 [Bergeyella porcorum]|uniref:Uncharacterized protein n=1 Tax=Bergeyella porcorum TaxID=1735111 RepID=A0AAU0EYN0_9FLAO